MSAQTGISWTDSTFNPWMGCTKVSPACDHCYAERDTKRFGRVEWGAGKPRMRTSAANWKLPERWNAVASFECPHCGLRGDAKSMGDAPKTCEHLAARPTRRRVFCASLADWLDNEVPIEWLVDLLDLIRRTPNIDWLLLTKRIGNWRSRLEDAAQTTVGRQMDLNLWLTQWLFARTPPENVWLGATVVNQGEVDRDVPKLLRVPARVRFLSIEPMLGPINLRERLSVPWNHVANRYGRPCIDWIIAGGESGPHARPMHPDWVRSLRDQCAAAGVPFHFKQWGKWGPDFEGAQTCESCGRTKFDAINSRGQCGHCGIDGWQEADKPLDTMRRMGTRAAGRQLDGIEHNGFPS